MFRAKIVTFFSFVWLHDSVFALSSFLSNRSGSMTQSKPSSKHCQGNRERKMRKSVRASAAADFNTKSVFLTGATGGLGKALALQLSECGVRSLILSGRSELALEGLAKECRQVSSNPIFELHTVVCDLSDPEQVKMAAARVLDLAQPTGIEVLINNGGVSSRSRFVDTLPDVDRKVMQINFLAGAYFAKAVTPAMIQNGSGQIIWISSVQGLVGIPNRSSYAASKFAVQGYCESIRAELASSGVSVHTISPGYIRTNLSKSAITGDGGNHGKMDETTAAGADPYDVAVQVLESCSANQAELVVAAGTSAKAAIWMRLLCPRMLQRLLVKRYEKSQKEKME